MEILCIAGYKDPKADNVQLLHSWLRTDSNSEWLMIIDNIDDLSILDERVLSPRGPNNVLQFLTGKFYGQLLFTTRDRRVGERLAVRGNTIIVPAMSLTEGRQLLLAYSNTPLEYKKEEADYLINALDCVPLAISQAGAYILEKYMSIMEYTSLLTESAENTQRLLNVSLSDGRRGNTESNSVIKTWNLSFDQIMRQDPDAGHLLCVMAMFHNEQISLDLLNREPIQHLDFVSSLATLRNFSLVSRVPEGYRMHRLVQVSVQAWLKLEGTLLDWQQIALSIVADVFPSGEYETWARCNIYLPHAKSVLKYQHPNLNSSSNRARLLHRMAWFDRQHERYEMAKCEADEAAAIFKSIAGSRDPRYLTSTAKALDCLIMMNENPGKLEEPINLLQNITGVMQGKQS